MKVLITALVLAAGCSNPSSTKSRTYAVSVPSIPSVPCATGTSLPGVITEPFVIADGEHYVVGPGETVEVQNTSIIVHGRLTVCSQDPTQPARLQWTGINEGSLLGGMAGHLVDPGLWVEPTGQLDARGLPVSPSARVLAVSGQTLTLDRVPVSWRVGATIAIHSMNDPANGIEWEHLTLSGVDGTAITVSEPMQINHAPITGSTGVVGAVALYLERSVQIHGEPTGRTHVHVTSQRSQRIQYADLAWSGQPVGTHCEPGGRYGLHLHKREDGSRGDAVYEGVLVRHGANHAFVPHASHGIHMRGVVAYDTLDDAFWWDFGDSTNEFLCDECVAAKIRPPANGEHKNLTGFALVKGNDLWLTRPLAVDVWSTGNPSGFLWPKQNPNCTTTGVSELPGAWELVDAEVLQSKSHGLRAASNDTERHRIRGLRVTAVKDDPVQLGSYIWRPLMSSVEAPGTTRIRSAGASGAVIDSLTTDELVMSKTSGAVTPNDDHWTIRNSRIGTLVIDDSGHRPRDFRFCGTTAETISYQQIQAGTEIKLQHDDGTAEEWCGDGWCPLPSWSVCPP